MCTNFSKQPQASAVTTLRYCSPKGVKSVLTVNIVVWFGNLGEKGIEGQN